VKFGDNYFALAVLSLHYRGQQWCGISTGGSNTPLYVVYGSFLVKKGNENNT
jgi:hypothetical protein